MKILELLVDNMSWLCCESLPGDSWHSNWYELCTFSRGHLSVFIWNGTHTVFALNGKETFIISVQSHLHVHRWCIVYKQLRTRKLSGKIYPAKHEIKDTTESITFASYPDLLLSIRRNGLLHTSIYDKRDDFNFHITNFPFLSSNIPCRFYLSAYMMRPGLLLAWMFYSEGQVAFQ